MRTANKHAEKIVRNINRRQLANNVQKVLLSLVRTSLKDGWVPRTAFGVPSVGARVRDLRKDEFGGFRVECMSANDRGIVSRSKTTNHQTFYRIVPNTVTVNSLTKALKGVM